MPESNSSFDREAITDLATAVERLADEVHALWQTLDEIRDDLAWAILNGRLGTVAGDSPAPTP